MSKKLYEPGARRSSSLFRLSLLSLAIILLAGGFALLNGGAVTRPDVHADYGDLSVVGPPSLSATAVNAIFARLGSPMSGTGAVVEQVSQQTQIDDAFALGVWWAETNDGASGVGLADRNPGSVRGSTSYPSAYDSYTIYPTYTDAIAYWFHMLRNLYVIGRGLTTVYAISHPYVGTSSSSLWAGKVIALMLSYRGEAPPPTPVPTLPPSPTFSPPLPHNRPAARLVVVGALSPTATTQPGRQQATLADSVRTVTTPPRSIGTWLIVFTALLLALVIALWGVRIALTIPDTQPLDIPLPDVRLSDGRPPDAWQPDASPSDAQPLDAHKGHPYIWAGRPTRPLSLPTRPGPESLFARLPETPGARKIHRVMLLPARQDDETREVEGCAGIRSGGLLARYGQSPQE